MPDAILIAATWKGLCWISCDIFIYLISIYSDRLIYRGTDILGNRQWPQEQMQLLWGSCIQVSARSEDLTLGLVRVMAWCPHLGPQQLFRRCKVSSPRYRTRLFSHISFLQDQAFRRFHSKLPVVRWPNQVSSLLVNSAFQRVTIEHANC